MKKLSTLFLLALLPLMASAYDAEVDGIYYNLNTDTKEAVVTSSNNNKYTGNVTIPENFTINGITYNVTSIGNSAFYECSELTSVSISNNVTSIGRSAFYKCTNLTSVIIPDGVTNIEAQAFIHCSSLTTITIPGSITILKSQLFNDCTSLKSVTIPKSVTEVESRVFYKCYSLRELYCYAENVPTTNIKAFYDTNISPSTLYVPRASIDAYKTASPWSGFGTIKAIEDVKPEVTSIAINETNFPDENFRNWILSQSYGSDGVLTDDEIAGISVIGVTYQNVKSLKGIEFFTALEYLYCSNNQLTALDVSKNTKLTKLYCNHNQLTALDVSKNTAMTWLYCYNNQFTALNVSKNTAMKYLSCGSNQLTTLDVSKNTALTELDCDNNRLTALDVSKNTALKRLYCYSNHIKDTAMDALVENLPTVSSGTMLVINNENEGNVMTKTQVAAAKANGWTPQYTINGINWQDYAGSEPEALKCAPPVIAYSGSRLVLKCATEGVKYVCNLGFETDENVRFPSKVKISIHATKDGYEPSDTLTQEIDTRLLLGKVGDINGDGEVGMPDVMYIVNYILNGKFPE